MAEFKKAVNKVRRRTAANLRNKKAEKEFKKANRRARRMERRGLSVQGFSSYDVTLQYIKQQLPGKFVDFNEQMNEIISTGVDFLSGAVKLENHIHEVLLQAVDLKGLQDLTLSNSEMDELVLKNIRVTDGNSSVGLSDLRVMTRRISPTTIKDIAANPVAPPQPEGYKLAKVQVIPLTDSLYMGLSKKGGFYLREGNYLVPLILEDTTDYVKALKKLNSKAYLKDAVKNIYAFNKFINSMNNGAKFDNDPVKLINSVRVESSTPKSTVSFGAAGVKSNLSPSTSSGQQGNALGDSKPFETKHPEIQATDILAIPRTDTPFEGINKNRDTSWRAAYQRVHSVLPVESQRYYNNAKFNRDLAIAAMAFNESPNRLLENLPSERERLINVANLSLNDKVKFEISTLNAYLRSKGLPEGSSLAKIDQIFTEHPSALSEFKTLMENPQTLHRFAPSLDF